MKKLLLFIPLLIISCKKETTVTNEPIADSTHLEIEQTPANNADSVQIKDSIVNNATATKEVLRRGVMRTVEGNRIIRTADAEQLPFSIGEEFTDDGQEFVLKIENFSAKNLRAKVASQNPQMNIRINQIRFADGKTDGPFSKEISQTIDAPGEVWLIISKNNMASGETKGNFTVSLE